MKYSVLILCIVVLSTSSCDNNWERRSVRENHSAIEMLQVVFEGGFSEEVIQSSMDKVLLAYGVDITEENYARYGSVLVRLRKEAGVREMDIINNMIEINTGKLGISFTEQAALSATVLESMNY